MVIMVVMILRISMTIDYGKHYVIDHKPKIVYLNNTNNIKQRFWSHPGLVGRAMARRSATARTPAPGESRG